ncbi:hypothetical protein BDZ91DRAFT_317773 [Kalaharituber pfeilii]|nr:hypothetical protein BDZ91DRAFT_317773 [Kalaharituber pfeilii]
MADYNKSRSWGYLITEDKEATRLLKSLYRAIVNYIVHHIQPRQVRYLTPEKLAAFYKEVGGDLDSFFLNSDPLQISDVYTTLGCVHSLLPNPEDDYSPPRIPALHPRGFERWQTIQLLLEPDEHAPYIQEAVRKFELIDPQTGQGFREYGELPRTAFPKEPDEATWKWHENVFLKRLKDNEEREKAAAEEKVKNTPSDFKAPGGGTAEAGIRLDDDEDTKPMKGEGLRTPYSSSPRSPSRHKGHSRSSSTSRYYDSRSRSGSRSPLPKHAVDPDRLYATRRAYSAHHRYVTPDPPSDMEERFRSRKPSHVQYVFDNGDIDRASIRSVSPSVREYSATTSSHHARRRSKERRRLSSERIGARGRSAEPFGAYYAHGRYSREDSHSPAPRSRPKSHDGPSYHSSNESLHRAYRPYNMTLPPVVPHLVYQQEEGAKAGHLRPVTDSFPVDYYQFHFPPPQGGSSTSSSTAHPLSGASVGVRASIHHTRGNSPDHSGHRRHGSDGRGRSGASSRYHSSSDSLPRDFPPIPPLSGKTVPTTTPTPPQKAYAATVTTDSEDENASHHLPHYHHHHSSHRYSQWPSQSPDPATQHRRSQRRDRERERDRGIDNDRIAKMQQMGATPSPSSYEEDISPGGRRKDYSRTSVGGKPSSGVSGGGSGSSGRIPPYTGVMAGGYPSSPYVR